MRMSQAHSQAMVKRWSKVAPAKRSKTMQKIAKDRMSKLTDKQRKEIGKRLVKARKEKTNE